MKRAIVVVIDSMGCGALPDATEYNDDLTCNTLANLANATGGLNVPNLEKMGFGNIIDINGVKKVENPTANYGILKMKSKGKDTTTGHWELMGLVLENPFKTYVKFDDNLINEFWIYGDGKFIENTSNCRYRIKQADLNKLVELLERTNGDEPMEPMGT